MGFSVVVVFSLADKYLFLHLYLRLNSKGAENTDHFSVFIRSIKLKYEDRI